MELPAHVVALIETAHDAFEKHATGRGSLHDSSTATVAARNATCEWLMNVIYKRDEVTLQEAS